MVDPEFLTSEGKLSDGDSMDEQLSFVISQTAVSHLKGCTSEHGTMQVHEIGNIGLHSVDGNIDIPSVFTEEDGDAGGWCAHWLEG